MGILTILSIPIHDHEISFHLFVSNFINVLQFLVTDISLALLNLFLSTLFSFAEIYSFYCNYKYDYFLISLSDCC